MGKIFGGIGVFFALIILLIIFLMSNFSYRVDAGKVGLLINYTQRTTSGQPEVTILAQSSFNWYNSWGGQTVFEYPVALQTLSMVANPAEGQQQGDDSVSFVTQHGIPLRIDVTVQWRVVDPARLYYLMPGVPLDGNFNHDVSTKLVRQTVIHALNQTGGTYAWQDAASNENAIEQAMLTQVGPIMSNYGIAIEQIALGQPHYSNEQQSSINQLAQAQQVAQQAQFLKQKAQYESEAAAIQAQSQAQQIGIIQAQLGKSPDYLQYQMIQMYREKWDGKLPAALSTDGKGNSLLVPFQK